MIFALYANDNCKNINGYYVGGGLSNALYSTNFNNNYILSLNDDGNMCIYKNNAQQNNSIWCSNTNCCGQKVGS
jgi:hypothetical protein